MAADDGRVCMKIHTPAAAAAVTAATATRRDRFARDRDGGRAATASGPVALPGRADRNAALSDVIDSAIAAPKWSAVANRSAGARARALRTAHSRRSGISSRIPASEGAGPESRFAIITWTVAPENGGSPAIISYSTHPSE